jgi:hypothetical protein
MERQTCISCGQTGPGRYCSACGQQYATKRISLKGLLHDVLHFFTHLEKGFWYTAKQLLLAPGTMQRSYIDGVRNRHQKPISMFILCLSANALVRYWLLTYLNQDEEARVFHKYLVLIYAVLTPVIAFITYLLFIRNRYNYIETGVLQLYSFAFIFLFDILIWPVKLLFHNLDMIFIELPLISAYMLITYVRFYNHTAVWQVLLKSALVIAITIPLAQWAEQLVKMIVK